MVLVVPFVLLGFVMGLVHLSERIGRLFVRPADAPVVRWYARGLLHALVWPVGVYVGGDPWITIWLGETPAFPGALLFLASALVATGLGHRWLGRLEGGGEVDGRLLRSARVVLGVPMLLQALATVALVGALASLPSGPLSTSASAIGYGALLLSVLAYAGLALSAPFFLVPVVERRPDGSVSSPSMGELWSRWTEQVAPEVAVEAERATRPAARRRPVAQAE